MMRTECVEAVSQALGRQITAAEAKKIEQRIIEAQKHLWKKDRTGMTGLTKNQQLRRAAEQAAKDLVEEAQQKKQRLAEMIIIHDNNRTYFEHQPGLMLDNVPDKLAGDKVMSVESLTETTRHRVLAFLADTIEPFLPTKIGFDQGNTKMEAVYRELHGQDTGNAPAKAYAQKLRDVFESLRLRFNEAGGKIKWLEDWAHPQAHSAYLVFKMGKNNWMNYISPKLNRNRYINADGSRFSDEQFTNFLGSTWDILAYGGHANLEPGTGAHGGIRANAHSQSRELHFLGADEYLAYHKLLGEKSLHATIISHIDTMSRDIALLEIMSPDPEGEFNYWNDYAYQDAIIQGHDAGKLEKKYLRNQRLYNEVSGSGESKTSGSVVRWMDALRALNLISLGSSSIMTLGDLGTMMLTANLNKMSQSRMLVEHLRALGDAESRRAARRLGIGVDVLSGVILRHGQEQITNGLAAKVGGAVVRLSGMPFVTEANRQAFSIVMMDTLQHVISTYKDLASIHKTDARMLFTHGIDEADFALWKQAVPELWVDGKSLLLTANAVRAIPGIDAKILRKSADKLMALVLDEQNMAVIVPGAKQAAFMNLGLTRGTFMGELARSFWQFKSFAITLPWKHLERAYNMESKQSAVAYAAAFTASAILFGAISTQLKEIVAGRDPLKMDNYKFATKALLASGGLGLFGDFLFSQNTSFGSSLLETFAGPTINRAIELKKITWDNSLKAAHGETTHTAAEALRLANTINPLGTLWFTKSAFNHLVLQNLQEALSPGYLRRTTQRAQREFGQSYYWKPGQTTPDRLPNLSKAFE